MHIQIENRAQNTIASYSESQLIVNDTVYQDNIVISSEHILSPWPVQSLMNLTIEDMKALVELNPKIILIGHSTPGMQIPIAIPQWLSTQQIGVECMLLGAACRTFNVLLSEGRNVVAGFIFDKTSLLTRHCEG